MATRDLVRLAGISEQEAVAVLRSRQDRLAVWNLIKILIALGADIGIYVLPDGGHDRGVVLSEAVNRDRGDLNPQPGRSA